MRRRATTISATRSRAGFTFVELFLVILIILALTSTAFVQFRTTFRAISVNTAAQRVFSLCRFLQGRSIAERRLFRFSLADNGSPLVSVLQGDGYVPVSGRSSGSFSVPDGVIVSIAALEGGEPLAQVTFYPDGSADSARITARDNQGNERAVAIKGMRGAITVE